ncbi:MAG: SUMF1/EgtB/PvdO family nonheme iron enzyme [Verrucomicrobiales bacterium]|nr:SUMF1/EgtB/PvdO family nonheme iron enzyme [Verrucomicrobiales bacterium]
MKFFRMSPVKFFVAGAGITLVLNCFLYISQLVTDHEVSSVSVSKTPKFGSLISKAFAGDADSRNKAGVFTNGMGMHFVPLPDLDIGFGVYEVTKEQFRFFAEATGLEEKRWLNRVTRAGLSQPDNHPVVNVSWEEATRFCEWLSKQENTVFRLPTDYEWSVAAGLDPETSFLSPCLRSKDAPEEYFWGEKWQTENPVGNYADKSHESITGSTGCFPFDDGYPATAPVGSFLPNKFGIYNMGGNVSEWVYDWYRSRDEFKTVRGASYGSGLLHKEAHYKGFRAMSTPAFRSEYFGFRIVAENLEKLHAVDSAIAPEIASAAPAVETPVDMPAQVQVYDPPVYNSATVAVQEMVASFPAFAPSTEEVAVEPPVPTADESPALAMEAVDPAGTKPVWVTYTGKDGVNLREDQSFESGNKLGAIFSQSTMPLLQIGEDVRIDTETWVNVEVKGWLPTKNSTHSYLADQGDGTWKVTWSKPNDRFVAMRAGTSSEDTLISKVSYATVVEELDQETIGSRHYILAKFSGWVVKQNTSRSYISDLK